LIPDPSPLRSWFPRILGTFLFVALLVWLDRTGALPLDRVFSTLLGANVWLVSLSIAFYVPFTLVKAERWRVVCGDMGMPLRRAEALPAYAVGLAAGTFTPGQAGDVLKALYLQRLGYTLGRALGSSVLDRLFDVAGLAALGLLGIAVYGQRFAGQTTALALLTLACVAAAAFFAWNRTREWAVKLVSRKLSEIRNQKSEIRDDYVSAEKQVAGSRSGEGWSLRRETVVAVALLTMASFGISIFRVWLLAAALGLFLGPLEVAGFVGLTTAAALVPVSVGGVGTRDAVAALALAQLGRPATEAVALSSLILLLNATQAVIGWVVWLRYR
jgi:hypothetical protein